MVVSNPPGEITIEDRNQRNRISWACAARLAGPSERSSCSSTTKGAQARVHFYNWRGMATLLKPTVN